MDTQYGGLNKMSNSGLNMSRRIRRTPYTEKVIEAGVSGFTVVLEIFTGSGPEFSQLFKIRGLPTTILIDRNGFEVGRIVGYIDFNDQSLLDWLSKNL